MPPPDIRNEPYKSVYMVMTDILEDAVEAQERGDVAMAAALAEEASILGKAIGILAKRADR